MYLDDSGCIISEYLRYLCCLGQNLALFIRDPFLPFPSSAISFLNQGEAANRHDDTDISTAEDLRKSVTKAFHSFPNYLWKILLHDCWRCLYPSFLSHLLLLIIHGFFIDYIPVVGLWFNSFCLGQSLYPVPMVKSLKQLKFCHARLNPNIQ